ncbi:alanine racemase [Tamaricihabitans halophyticus]|uniref:Alanine racemase n=1 Tax=Tamaricihabitans halophyticus TaxID=1262583 RepID=A0A4R2QWF2_9PSEU|nr:alanine racemase [Tamaricihabitans halophyticus]
MDLDAVRHNVTMLAERAGDAELMVVVKADGYGHGAVQIAKAALEAGASWLGVCSLAEGLRLRAAGIRAPMLSWLDVPETDFAPAVAAGIDISVSSLRELRAVRAASDDLGGVGAHVHLKIDTGLSRNGCPSADWPDLVRAAAAAEAGPHFHVRAVWSHLACADEPGHPSIDQQAERFAAAYSVATEAGLRPMRHLANSAATLTRADLRFDLVRAGIAVYGLNPVPQHEDLIPAMTFASTVVLTKRVAAGESVSYGHTWTAPRDTTLALVPVGYADGVPRGLSGHLRVLLGGRSRPVVGRVCMDQLVVDCGDDPIAAGDRVVLFGTGKEGEQTATEWADQLGTIDYEIVTGMCRPRVARRYLGEDAS